MILKSTVIKNFDDCLRLQQDLNRLSQWSTVWLLRFNAAKCKAMRIGYSPILSYTMTDSSTNSSVTLEEVNEEKDLGVWCTNTLKPSLHCQRAAVKTTQVLGLIRRSFKIKSIDTLVFLYKMYVWPHLEYCVQVWNPYLARDIDILEKVQRRATKCLDGLSDLSYVTEFWKITLMGAFCTLNI